MALVADVVAQSRTEANGIDDRGPDVGHVRLRLRRLDVLRARTVAALAADAFRKATESDANFADAFYQLGVTLTGMASVDPQTGGIIPVPGTKEALEKYIQLAPSGPNSAAAKSLLETMAGTVTTQVGGSKDSPQQQRRR